MRLNNVLETPEVAIPPARGTVMVIEDEDTVREVFSRVLRRGGYRVLEARNGVEALIITEEIGDGIDVVLSDVVMPGMNGPETIDRLLMRRPKTKVLYVSGYTRDIMLRFGVTDTPMNYLQKPVSPRALSSAVQAVLNDLPLDFESEMPKPVGEFD